MTVQAIKQRDTTIDTVKCLLIFSIFVFHYGTSAGKWYPFFGAFHVPAFFMVSGFWAMNRINRSVWTFVKNAVQKYLVHWFTWVLLYTALFSILGQYSLPTAWQLFLKYFFAVRSSGIGGMWFVPAFFLVTFCYFLVAKLLAKIPGLSSSWQEILHCGIALFVYLAFWKSGYESHPMVFSVHQVPIHWFYYALGRVLYHGWQWFRQRPVAVRRGGIILAAVLSFGYLLFMFFQWHIPLWGELWQWLPILPTTVGVVMALCGLFLIARVIRCGFLARIGRVTLGLCLCETLVKYPMKLAMEYMGWQIGHPLVAFGLAMVALLLGCFLVIPPVDWVIDKAIGWCTPKTKE